MADHGSFHLYYGAAPDQATALEALTAVNAPVYALAKPDGGGPGSGAANMFVLGYRPVSYVAGPRPDGTRRPALVLRGGAAGTQPSPAWSWA
ncbi:hypothetical protein ABT026_05330 [Streptomyces sp. NPDC002734]|uniref:hypothetical protein n=1 Tax=Streptomyces sp. NPDC002734 TaxID=3154426 RepID=UPI0033270072